MKYKAQTWFLPLRWSESAVYFVLSSSLFLTHADLFAPSALHRFQVHWDLFVILLSFSSESLIQMSSTGKHGGRPLYRDLSRVLQQRACDSDSWLTFTLTISLEIHERPDCFVLLSIFFQARPFCSSMHDIFPTEYDSLTQRYRPLPLRNDWTVTTPISLPLITVHFSPGPVSQKSRTFRAHFGWHNSLCIFKTKASWATELCCYNNFYSLYNIWKDQLHRISGSECYECLFGSETFSGLSRNGPLVRLIFEFCPKFFSVYFNVTPSICLKKRRKNNNLCS